MTSTLVLVDSKVRNRQISVTLDLAPIDPVDCYPAELNQVFMNLILNAVQAMDSGGCLTITAREEKGEIVIEFADTGDGISEEISEKVFDPFFTTKAVGQGTGLGLTLSRKIITEGHHGSLTFRTDQGTGSVFRISIPRSANP